MSLRDVLGLYGPNRPTWDTRTYDAITRSKVNWVVWRTDADNNAPHHLAGIGVKVIAQAPDRFNGNPWLDPGRQAAFDYGHVRETCLPGTPFVHDNEPQLNPLRAGQWYAEQWTRYSRAYAAVWRWLDHSGDYPLLTPALAVGPDRNGGLWHRVGRENLLEANGIALHAYWQQPAQIIEPDFGAPWALIPVGEQDNALYVLEYANTWPSDTHETTLGQYEVWLRNLPAQVRCACLFGLDLTADWNRFRVTEPVLDWLASLE